MEIKETVNRTIKDLLEWTIVIGVLTLGLKNTFKHEVFMNICTSLMVLGGVAGFFVVFNRAADRQNNKSSALGVSYIGIVILLTIKLYFDVFIFEAKAINYEPDRVQLTIDLLEIIALFVTVKCVNKQTNLRQYTLLSIAVLISSLLISYRINFTNLLTFNLFLYKTCLLMIRTGLFMFTLIFGVICYYKDHERYQVSQYKTYTVLSFHALYQLSYLLLHLKVFLFGDIVLCVLKFAFYMNVFYMIHHNTHCILWRSTDEDLEDKTKKLAEDLRQKNNLVFVADKLQEYVDEISSSATVLKNKYAINEEAKNLKYVRMMIQNGYRLKKLAYDIKAIQQIEKGELIPQFVTIDMVKLLEELIESIEPYAAVKEIEIKLMCAEECIKCSGDVRLIEHIVLNLLSNAIKYNKEKGTITLYVNAKGNSVYLCIKDTGIGIPYSRLNTIFNRFERGDYEVSKQAEGSGLGLPIVKSLIEMHKGSICIVSKEGRGTTVSVELPRDGKESASVYSLKNNDKEKLKNSVRAEFSDFKI